jgi:hypothetical protein
MSMVFYFVSNGNLASVEKWFGPLRFRLRQVLLYDGSSVGYSTKTSSKIVLKGGLGSGISA